MYIYKYAIDRNVNHDESMSMWVMYLCFIFVFLLLDIYHDSDLALEFVNYFLLNVSRDN